MLMISSVDHRLYLSLSLENFHLIKPCLRIVANLDNLFHYDFYSFENLRFDLNLGDYGQEVVQKVFKRSIFNSSAGVVAQLIDSLDDIQLMAGGRKEDISFLQWLFEIPLLHTLLEVLFI